MAVEWTCLIHTLNHIYDQEFAYMYKVGTTYKAMKKYPEFYKSKNRILFTCSNKTFESINGILWLESR